MNKTIATLLITILSASAQASWKVRSAYKEIPGQKMDRSVLYFTSGDSTKTYAPAQAPWGLVDTEKYITPKGEFFLTTWAKGGQSVLLRVFDMSSKEATPICENTSFAETSKLKLTKGTLYVLVLESFNAKKEVWQPCAKINPQP